MRISAVVICARQHFVFLPRLLNNLEKMTVQFDEIILVCSNFNVRQKFSSVSIINSHSELNIKKIFVGKGSAGKNRNIGWKFADGDLTCFLDADDTYSPFRNKFLLERYSLEPFDLLLHSYKIVDTQDHEFISFEELRYEVFRNEDLYQNTFPQDKRDKSRELELPLVDTNLRLPLNMSQFEFSHGHLTVSRKVRGLIKFHELAALRNEDGVFARDALESGLRIQICSAILSNYSQGTSAIVPNNLLTRTFNFTRKIMRINSAS
ncbi:MAG: glycosyltransferase family A protein [Aurantimicrobium sp.]|uniref:glycosyltransferase family A protein n=1 Tax=Aurantimicrobium sp. TaxID=1930784 RepID=UPI002FCC1D6A